MTYKLKTTGIATSCTMCVAIDPDTGTIKDFASAGVTADLLVGANVTFGTQEWDGNTRNYWVPGVGTTDADFVKFGATKPAIPKYDAVGEKITALFIGEAAGNYVRLFGADSSTFFASSYAGNANTYPTSYFGAVAVSGGFALPSAGQKIIFGFSLDRSASNGSFAYASIDTASSASVYTHTNTQNHGAFSLAYLNRRPDSTAHQQDKTHAVLTFSTALTQAEVDSLRDDWFGVLLEAESGSVTNGTGAGALASITLTAPTGTATGTSSSTNATGTGTLQSIVLTAPAGTATGTSAGSGTITTPVLKNNTGTVLANETGVIVNVYHASTGALIVQKTAQTSSALGVVVITDALLTPATTYAYEVILTGSRRRLPVASAA